MFLTHHNLTTIKLQTYQILAYRNQKVVPEIISHRQHTILSIPITFKGHTLTVHILNYFQTPKGRTLTLLERLSNCRFKSRSPIRDFGYQYRTECVIYIEIYVISTASGLLHTTVCLIRSIIKINIYPNFALNVKTCLSFHRNSDIIVQNNCIISHIFPTMLPSNEDVFIRHDNVVQLQ